MQEESNGQVQVCSLDVDCGLCLGAHGCSRAARQCFEGPGRTGSGDQIRRPQHCGGAEPAGGETAVPVGNTGRDLHRAGQGLEALRKGGVQRIYVGNVPTGDHQLEVLVDGKIEGGADFSRTERFTVRKEVKPKLVGLTLAGPGSANTPITLGEW
jgi:hypothetical protein